MEFLIPLPAQLLEAGRNRAEAELGCHCTLTESGRPLSLYAWAEDILRQLADDKPEPTKLRLGRALGLLSDDRWLGRVNVPLRGTWPRHRVIARFAREKLWAKIWSFNWDCILENALECVGFDRGAPLRVQPWITRFDTIVTSEDFPLTLRQDFLCVFKPHGCVRALLDAVQAIKSGDREKGEKLSNRFMITESELTKARRNPTDYGFFDMMRVYLRGAPVVIAGWSVSEPYLLDVFNDTLRENVRQGVLEELTVIDPSFREGHKRVADLYGLTQEAVHFDTSPAGGWADTDALFLWLQARYCIDQLSSAASGDAVREQLDERAGALENSGNNVFLIQWADDFIPAWTRMCWRGEVVDCAGFQPHQLALEKPDEHIPLSLRALPRPDLASAGRMLCSFPVDGGPWNLSRFPGAFWRQDHLRLVIPLPTWKDMSDLAALKPLMASHDLGFVERMDILPVHPDPGALHTEAQLQELKSRLNQVLSLPAFATPADIGIADDIPLIGVENG